MRPVGCGRLRYPQCSRAESCQCNGIRPRRPRWRKHRSGVVGSEHSVGGNEVLVICRDLLGGSDNLRVAGRGLVIDLGTLVAALEIGRGRAVDLGQGLAGTASPAEIEAGAEIGVRIVRHEIGCGKVDCRRVEIRTVGIDDGLVAVVGAARLAGCREHVRVIGHCRLGDVGAAEPRNLDRRRVAQDGPGGRVTQRLGEVLARLARIVHRLTEHHARAEDCSRHSQGADRVPHRRCRRLPSATRAIPAPGPSASVNTDSAYSAVTLPDIRSCGGVSLTQLSWSHGSKSRESAT